IMTVIGLSSPAIDDTDAGSGSGLAVFCGPATKLRRPNAEANTTTSASSTIAIFRDDRSCREEGYCCAADRIFRSSPGNKFDAGFGFRLPGHGAQAAERSVPREDQKKSAWQRIRRRQQEAGATGGKVHHHAWPKLGAINRQDPSTLAHRSANFHAF